VAERRDEPVPMKEAEPLERRLVGGLGQEGTRCRNFFEQGSVAGRVRLREAAGEHRHGLSVRRERPAMGRRVDAQRTPGDDHEAGAGQVTRQPVREVERLGVGATRAHDGHGALELGEHAGDSAWGRGLSRARNAAG
jgi:hypothetical protein